MTNPMGLKLKLTYLRVERSIDNPEDLPAQPVRVTLKGNKTPTKLVPITPFAVHDKCVGCVGYYEERNDQRVDCYQLPDCGNAIYVHANPANLLRHIEWRLENDK
jgi:hypothetical protein